MVFFTIVPYKALKYCHTWVLVQYQFEPNFPVKDGQGYTFSRTLESTLLLCSPKTQKGEVEKEVKNTQHVKKVTMNIRSCVHPIVANKIVFLKCACKCQLW